MRRRDLQQHLFPDITFTCNGSITKWIVGAATGAGVSLPELQIWRNVGETSYTKASFSILSSSTTPDNNNTVEYIPNPPLKFQKGDIVGVYQPKNADSALIVYNQEFDGPINYREGKSALFNVTLGSPDVYDYPLVTVEISTYAGTHNINHNCIPMKLLAHA